LSTSEEKRVTAQKVYDVLETCYCPFSTHLLQMIDVHVRAIDGVGEVDTAIVWNPVWTPERMTDSARQADLADGAALAAAAASA